MTAQETEHGGRLDAAVAEFGGSRGNWLDLSTGINPVPYPIGDLPPHTWTALPDHEAQARLCDAARRFWDVPQTAAVLAAPGASCLIAQLPRILTPATVVIAEPTYNEHRRAFEQTGVPVVPEGKDRVIVNPNNPDGRIWTAAETDGSETIVIDESFCDATPDATLIAMAGRPGCVVLKSFGKFWGLAGLRLGFAIGDPAIVGELAERLGPWPVSGPALQIGAMALEDRAWADATLARLSVDAARLDALMSARGHDLVGGTPLFRLYDVVDGGTLYRKLATSHILTRTFSYAPRWLRMGIPATEEEFDRVEASL